MGNDLLRALSSVRMRVLLIGTDGRTHTGDGCGYSSPTGHLGYARLDKMESMGAEGRGQEGDVGF